jgi:hypothetical protein
MQEKNVLPVCGSDRNIRPSGTRQWADPLETSLYQNGVVSFFADILRVRKIARVS